MQHIFRVKNLISINFITVKVVAYDVIMWSFGVKKTKDKLICNLPNDMIVKNR